MDSVISISLIGGLEPRDLASHFKRLRAGGLDEMKLSTLLLNAVRTEGLCAAYTMPVWLSFVQDPLAIVEALRQQFSTITRRCAIKALGRFLKQSNWNATWNAVGAIPGLLSLFAELPVADVAYLSNTIGHCAKGRRYADRDRQVTVLFCGLAKSHFPNAAQKSSDQRPLLRQYVRLLPACSTDFIETLLLTKPQLFKSHPSILCLRRHSVPFAKLTREILFEKRACAIELQYILPSVNWEVGDGFRVQPGWNISMSFALELLRRLAQSHAAVDIPQHFPLASLIESLTEQAIRKKWSWESLREIIGLSTSILAVRSDVISRILTHDSSFLQSVVRCWSEKPTLFEHQLKELLGLVCDRQIGRRDCYVRSPYLSHARSMRWKGSSCASSALDGPWVRATCQLCMGCLIQRTAPKLRYTLLRLLLLHANDPPRDIDSSRDLKDVQLKWPLHVFQALPSDRALALLERLLKARPAQDFLGLEGGGILALPPRPGLSHGDPRILRLYLMRGTNAVAEAAESGKLIRQMSRSRLTYFEAVDSHKKKAATAREPNDRAFFAKSALFNAIVSGSLKLVGDVVLWMRRYVRDPLTVKSLFSADVVGCQEGIDLLSGIPEKLSLVASIIEVSQAVKQSNDILRALFETACQALREPSYFVLDWRGPLTMLGRVVEARLNRIAATHRDLNVSDDDIYQAIWSGTIEMLLHVERTALESGHERLDFNYLDGPLGGGGRARSSLSLKRNLPSSLRFIDHLARARNELWQEYRPFIFPAVTALLPPWPRGLPIQFLLHPFQITLESTDNLMPFISSRAEEVVFLRSSVALRIVNDSKEVREAIGPFMDDYATALKIYVLQACSDIDRQNRVSRAWKHALKALTGHRMTTDEATRYWRSHFARALPDFSFPDSMDIEEGMWPILPVVDDAQQTEEWNPSADEPPRFKLRDLSPIPACIDCMITASRLYGLQITSVFMASSQRTIGPSRSSGVWNLSRFPNPQKLPRPIREGLVVSALLYLDSKKGGSRRILASSDPSADVATRYPLLFLDEEFLLRTDLSEPEALKVLEFYLGSIPPTLLLDLTTACVDELLGDGPKASTTVSLELVAFRLVSLLAKCDQPALAAKSIQNLILNLPDASSWHRRMLQPNFLRRLSPRETHNFLSSLIMSMQSIMEQQKPGREGSAEKERSDSLAVGTPSRPFIKVTTAKYVAQVLDQADFVSVDTTVDILSRMFESSTHLDVRVEVIQRMLGILSRISDDESQVHLANRLMTVIASTIDLIGGPNERKLMTDEDWAEADQNNILPDVEEESPILDVLLANALSTETSMKTRQNMMRGVLWPVIAKSIETNARWYKVFARKHRLVPADVPQAPYPIQTKMPLNLLVQCPEWVPLWLLEMYHRFLITNLQPSPEIQRITEKVLTEPTLRSSNAGQHWLSQHNEGSGVVSTSIIAGFLTKEWRPSLLESGTDEDGFQVGNVQEIVKDISHRLLMLYDLESHLWHSFTNQLAPRLEASRRTQDLQAWLANGRPVVEHLITLVESTRGSKAWQDNPDRRPSVLPSTFGMKLWLLPYPCLQPDDMAISTKCTILAEELVEQIEQLSRLNRPYRKEMVELTDAVMELSLEDRVRVGCEIGALSGEDRAVAMTDYLRLEMSEQLLADGLQVRDKDLQGSVQQVVKTWIRNDDEEVRRIGLRTVAKLRSLFDDLK